MNDSSKRPLFLLLALVCLVGIGLTNSTALADDSVSGPPSDNVTEKDRQFWSFQKLTKPTIPSISQDQRSRTAIDTLLAVRQAANGISFSADADQLTLVRRMCLDLLGVPPTQQIVSDFLADHSPDACERLADRLLASPLFGERWGRHWLDVVGYVDTVGFDVDVDLIIVSDQKWLYRDYVIRAFNSDKPYDRFLQEQLAGDELVDWRRAAKFTPEIREQLIATGYLRTAQDFTHEDVGNIPQNHFGTLHDTLEIVGSSLLGLTLNCARCHNHKFDALPQKDYYQLMAFFTPAYNPSEWKIVIPYDKNLPDRALADISPADKAALEKDNAELDRHIGELNQQRDSIRKPHRDQLFAEKLASLPEPIRADTQAAIAVAADKRDRVQAYLAEKFAGTLKVSDDEVTKKLSDDEKAAVAEIAKQTGSLSSQKKSFGKIQALWDVGALPATRMLIRGDYETPGEEVQPGFLRVLCDADSLASADRIASPFSDSSGRRLELARRLTERHSRAEGLVARVFVNRVWQHLFQTGIVPTPENFGTGGSLPTNPELLEWLSQEFVSRGWSVKSLIRSIVCSTVYRQGAQMDQPPSAEQTTATDPAKVDPDNKLIWRMPLKRLDSEAIRDCILATSGAIDATLGGAPIMLEGKPDGMIVVAENKLPNPSAKWRRSVYLLARRAFQLSELAVFDQPVVATNCSERARSAVPLQSLTMLNGAFVWDQADRFATALETAHQSETSSDHLTNAAFERAMVRSPTATERARSQQFLDQQTDLYQQNGLDRPAASHKALTHLCHTLLNTSEFLYVP